MDRKITSGPLAGTNPSATVTENKRARREKLYDFLLLKGLTEFTDAEIATIEKKLKVFDSYGEDKKSHIEKDPYNKYLVIYISKDRRFVLAITPGDGYIYPYVLDDKRHTFIEGRFCWNYYDINKYFEDKLAKYCINELSKTKEDTNQLLENLYAMLDVLFLKCKSKNIRAWPRDGDSKCVLEEIRKGGGYDG